MTGISQLYGKITVRVQSANKNGVLGVPTTRSPKLGRAIQGKATLTAREIRAAMRGR